MLKDQPQELSFEAAIERLEHIVQQMEASKLPLEELLVRYEEGIRLVGICNERLTTAQKRIETLSRDSSAKTLPASEPNDIPQEPKKQQNEEISLF
jgi:exodeoxyribonuclease VII small subunit